MTANWLGKYALLFLLLFFGLIWSPMAQGNLDKRVSLDQAKSISIGQLLRETEKDHDFFFSYNSDILPEDSLVRFDGYEGNVRGFLLKTLGDGYEFIETPGYVVIRYSPNKLYLDENDELQRGKSWMISGRIKDLKSNELIAFASVYEPRMLASAMTDKNGYFELKLKNPNETVLLTISKENYRDTTFVLLPPFEIEANKKKNRFKFYPDDASDEALQNTFFGRMMIGFREQMQGLNLSGFFAEMPAQVSLVPRLSTHGMMNSQVINHASFNILGGYTAGTNGVEIGGLFNINRKNANFLQAAGLFNLVGGNAEGVQLAGISNRVLGKAHGFQAAGLFNMTGPFEGFQVAGLYNDAKSAKGLQVAGLYNRSAGLTNVQVASLVNIGGTVTGMQLAPVLNIADSSAYPIGFVNLIKTGEKSFSLGFDETNYYAFTIRTGGTFSYGLIGMALAAEDRRYNWAVDAGLGLHLANTPKFGLDWELLARTSLGPIETTTNLAAMKLLPAYKPHRNIKIFCGPSLNFLLRQDPTENKIPGWVIEDNSNDERVQAWFGGISAGVAFVFY